MFSRSPSPTPVVRKIKSPRLTREQARLILANPVRTGYTYAHSRSYGDSMPLEYIHPNLSRPSVDELCKREYNETSWREESQEKATSNHWTVAKYILMLGSPIFGFFVLMYQKMGYIAMPFLLLINAIRHASIICYKNASTLLHRVTQTTHYACITAARSITAIFTKRSTAVSHNQTETHQWFYKRIYTRVYNVVTSIFTMFTKVCNRWRITTITTVFEQISSVFFRALNYLPLSARRSQSSSTRKIMSVKKMSKFLLAGFLTFLLLWCCWFLWRTNDDNEERIRYLEKAKDYGTVASSTMASKLSKLWFQISDGFISVFGYLRYLFECVTFSVLYFCLFLLEVLKQVFYSAWTISSNIATYIFYALAYAFNALQKFINNAINLIYLLFDSCKTAVHSGAEVAGHAQSNTLHGITDGAYFVKEKIGRGSALIVHSVVETLQRIFFIVTNGFWLIGSNVVYFASLPFLSISSSLKNKSHWPIPVSEKSQSGELGNESDVLNQKVVDRALNLLEKKWLEQMDLNMREDGTLLNTIFERLEAKLNKIIADQNQPKEDSVDHSYLLDEVYKLKEFTGVQHQKTTDTFNAVNEHLRTSQIQHKKHSQVLEEKLAELQAKLTTKQLLINNLSQKIQQLYLKLASNTNDNAQAAKLDDAALEVVNTLITKKIEEILNESNFAELMSKVVVQNVVNTSSGWNQQIEENVKAIIIAMLRKFSYDRTGEPDYALESSGGSVLSTRCTENYQEVSRRESFFGIPLWFAAYSPRSVIQRQSQNVNAGECWAVKGTQAYLVIKLARTLDVSAISYEHLPKELSISGTMESAPKKFKIWSLASENDPDKFLLGEYTYDGSVEPLQRFPVQQLDPRHTPIIEFELVSNYGGPFTCLYRLRVHGTPINDM